MGKTFLGPKGGIAIVLSLFFSLAGCLRDIPIEGDEDPFYPLDIPAHFPPMPVPDDNPMYRDKVELGRELFFDPILSVDSTVACVNCHLPQYAFTDQTVVSRGVEGRLGFRNSPTLANVGWAPVMLMDGGSPTLEQQIYVPLEDHNEMDFNMVLLTERLQANDYYTGRFNEVFGKDPDPFGITRALAAYERTLISGHALYDKVETGRPGASFNESEERGRQLFFSEELACSSCHKGFNFTDWNYYNTGLYTDYGMDSGRARITLDPDDAGKFRVPTLRNVEVTGPYMHDGSIQNLEEVIEHYNSGGAGHRNQDERIRPLGLTPEQKSDLLHFLYTLTDTDFLESGG